MPTAVNGITPFSYCTYEPKSEQAGVTFSIQRVNTVYGPLLQYSLPIKQVITKLCLFPPIGNGLTYRVVYFRKVDILNTVSKLV